MRLLRIRLTNFRGVADRELTFAEHGVTVVEGPNESGKSSTIEAFGLLLDELDSSRKEAVRAVKPRHSDASPEAEAEFRVGGYHLLYRKRWLRPLTELRILAPAPETLTGREAHERVLAILNQATDYDLFKALRVLQDKPFDVDRIAGSASLRAALDAAAGGAGPGDGSEDTLVQRVEKEFTRYFTPRNHQPTGEYRTALDAHTAATAEATDLAATLARVEADTERHGEVTARLADLQQRLLADRGDLEQLGQRAKNVETLRTRRDGADALVERASRDADLAAAAWTARQALVRGMSDYEGELTTLRDQIAAHAELRADADTRRTGAQAMHQSADEAHRLALRGYQAADADYRWMRDAHELERVRADREALAEADREVEAAAAESAATEIDDRAVDAIDQADRSVRDARTTIEVAAATVRVERLGGAVVTVTEARGAVPEARDGLEASQAAAMPSLPLSESSAAPAGSADSQAGLSAADSLTAGPATAASAAAIPEARAGAATTIATTTIATTPDLAAPLIRRITDPLVIEAEGILRITLAPGASERELRAKLDAAESALVALCHQTGVRDLAAARIRQQRHVEARAALVAAESARKRLSKDPAALADEQARLEARIADHLDRRDGSVLPPADRDEAETVAEHRRAESEETAANLDRVADALRSAEARANELVAEAQKLAGRAEHLAAEHEAARVRLAEARAAAEDQVIEQRDADAAKALAAAVQDRAAHDAAYREAEPDQVALLLGNARDVVGRTESEIAEARAELQHLAGRLDTVGDDLADRHREAEARRDAAEREKDSVTARAEAARLLRDTLLRRRDEATRAYQGPFKEQVERFGRLVFGASFGVTVDADLRVAARTLDGRTDPYAELSTGAREAVAMCVRLACAALVGPDGGVPVIIDDALGAADPGRRRMLGALLAHAGSPAGASAGAAVVAGAADAASAAAAPETPPEPTQIIVFTCDPDRYRAVGSAQVRSLGHNNDRDESPAS
ncbi:AAA family ATPase [Catenulispora sp. NF23]|uniref:AAA family ATPase n=1 Tax=Catenulispora pinistramenti TaxID=2705254 RepID=A0ABS5KUY4_9ACTN|nr:AAA family ATPase [Catenulispora pinistramenti]MBS2536730.1 AAA family ATPase [Catenulispora pinistramenti]MBS2549878.1 AAA family ATPase [Catenulispora pinistramenti]